MKRRNKKVALLLTLFLGGFGAHKFYLGQPAVGFFYIVFSWTLIPALIAVVEFWVLVFKSDIAFDAKYNLNFDMVNKKDE